MNKFRKLLVILFFAILIALIVSCSNIQFSSNGERIYYTSDSSSGKPIYSQGFMMMNGSFACVNCHGADGHGGNVFIMMNSFEVPNITWGHLTEDHGDHPPYTEESVKEAISNGIEPNGEEMSDFMPRWQMADEDLDDLIEFLKTLEE